jgi:hypothetical protein
MSFQRIHVIHVNLSHSCESCRFSLDFAPGQICLPCQKHECRSQDKTCAVKAAIVGYCVISVFRKSFAISHFVYYLNFSGRGGTAEEMSTNSRTRQQVKPVGPLVKFLLKVAILSRLNGRYILLVKRGRRLCKR